MSGIGKDASQVVGVAQEPIDRSRGGQADTNALDREIGIMQWRIREECSGRQGPDQLGKIERDLVQIQTYCVRIRGMWPLCDQPAISPRK